MRAAVQIHEILTAMGQGGRQAGGNPETLGELYQELLEDPEPAGVLTPYRHRKARGAFYTHPVLAEATVRHALTPLVRGKKGPVEPGQILALRVCDPAMGCGAFLLPALRFLAEAMAESLVHHGWVEGNGSRSHRNQRCWWVDLLAQGPPPRTAVELAAWPPLRVLLARCLHGVDVDPKATELARAALALETGSATPAGNALANNLRCGNALIGAWRQSASHYPFGAWRRRGGDHAHGRGVHFDQGCWTAAIASRRRELVADGSGVLRGLEDLTGSKDPECRAERSALDLWCALWFWPADHVDKAPSPSTMERPGRRASEIAVELAERHRFFHWELEFAEVFSRAQPGFDAVLGNPPWEILKPDSKAFFGEHDPLYGTYGKQRALTAQREMFERSDVIERAWLERCAYFQDLGNWTGRGRVADERSPFRHQGRGDPNAYKLFLELGHRLLREGGVLGMVVPSGLYTDLGCRELRELLMDRCRWLWLYSFENRERVFPIDNRFKFAPIVVQKGGRTDTIRTAFLRRDPDEWSRPEIHALPLRREQVLRFSPTTRSVLEITHPRDLEILEKICDGCVSLGSEPWGIRQVRELDMTNDSRLFLTKAEWEAEGFAPDGRGRWVRPGATRSEERALPLIEGRMVGAYCFNQKGWVSGKGRRAIWRELPNGSQAVEPQYVVPEENLDRLEYVRDVKLGFMAISSATNARSMVAAAIPGLPCGNAVPILNSRHGLPGLLALLGILNSTVFDYALRLRLGGVNLNFFLLEECPLPDPDVVLGQPELLLHCASLGWTHGLYSDAWATLGARFGLGPTAVDASSRDTPAARLQRRAVVDAAIAALYGLDEEDLAWILRDCEHPPERLRDRAFVRGLDPKGFWRVGRELEPEGRLTVQTLRRFRDLISTGSTRSGRCGDPRDRIRRFCAGPLP